MKRTILKLFLVCILAGICASGIDKIPPDDDPGNGGGGGCTTISTCTSGLGDGFVCTCCNTTCVTGRNLDCSCV